MLGCLDALALLGAAWRCLALLGAAWRCLALWRFAALWRFLVLLTRLKASKPQSCKASLAPQSLKAAKPLPNSTPESLKA